MDFSRLPEFTPDPALWSRIAAAHATRQRRRRGLFGAGGAAVAAALFAAVLVVPRTPSPDARIDAVAAGERESRMLEAEWLLVAAEARVLPTTRLRAIDAALQAAYDRGARADEVAPLWRQRNEALRGLLVRAQDSATGSAVATLTRI